MIWRAIGAAMLLWAFVDLLPGRSDWLQGWLLLGLVAVVNGGSSYVVWRHNPDLIRRRNRIGEGTRAWDKWVWLPGVALLYLGVLVVGGLDSGRYQWTSVSLAWWPLGAVLYTTAMALITWCMTTNPHFESTVRIQSDLGHRVVDQGPYRFVRHPAYTVFAFLLNPAMPFLLGSWWVAVPAGICTLWIVLRTELEDRMLRRELTGYAEYAARVRWRLIPWLY